MRYYLAICDEHGPVGPRRQRRGVADRDLARHDCATYVRPSVLRATAEHVPDDPTGLAGVARMALGAYLRQHPQLRPFTEELLSDAMLGCAQANAAYDPSRGATLATYAFLRATGAIRDGVRARAPLSRQEHARGLTRDDVDLGVRAPLSLQSYAEAHSVEVTVPDERAGRAYDAVDARLTVEALLPLLPKNERYIVEGYYLHDKRLHELGTELGVTESRACQLLKAGLKRARRAAAA